MQREPLRCRINPERRKAETCIRDGRHPGDTFDSSGGRKRMIRRMIADGLLEKTPPFKVTQRGRDALTVYEGFPVNKGQSNG